MTASAAVNLYGLLPIEDFQELITSYGYWKAPRGQIDTELVSYLEELSEYEDIVFDLEDGFLVHYELLSPEFEEVYNLCIKRLSEVTRKSLPKEEFINYENDYYFVTSAHWAKLRRFLIGAAPYFNEEEIEDVCVDLLLLIRASRIHNALSYIERAGIKLRAQQNIECYNLLLQIQESTRIWGNNGHTTDELTN